MRWTRGLSGITLAIHAAGRSGRGLLNKTVGEPETWWALLSFSQLKLSQSFAIDNLQISCFGHTLPFKSLGSIRFFLRMFLNKSLMLTKAEFVWLKARLKSSNTVKYITIQLIIIISLKEIKKTLAYNVKSLRSCQKAQEDSTGNYQRPGFQNNQTVFPSLKTSSFIKSILFVSLIFYFLELWQLGSVLQIRSTCQRFKSSKWAQALLHSHSLHCPANRFMALF